MVTVFVGWVSMIGALNTEASKDCVVSSVPSLTVISMADDPILFRVGVMDSGRLFPVPARRIFSSGTKSTFELVTLMIRSSAALSTSPIENAIGANDPPRKID